MRIEACLGDHRRELIHSPPYRHVGLHQAEPGRRRGLAATIFLSLAVLLLLGFGIWGAAEWLVVRSDPVGVFFLPPIALAFLGWREPRRASTIIFVVGLPIAAFVLIGSLLVSDESDGFWIALLFMLIPVYAAVLLRVVDYLQGHARP